MKNDLRVMKFGGTSVGDAERIRGAARIVGDAARSSDVVAVVSAMSGVTNRLVATAKNAAAGDEQVVSSALRDLRGQHAIAVDSLVKDTVRRGEINSALESVFTDAKRLFGFVIGTRELSAPLLDALSGVGERLCAPLFAGALAESGCAGVAIEATELIVTDDVHGRAEPLMNETRARATARLAPLIADRIVPVVTGFIGATRDGVPTTLGRGGSDYSATIIGASLGASEVVIWTDVDGVMTADPRIVSGARTLPAISYAEAAELAYFGAKVLHPKTLRPVIEAGIPVSIRNSFAPEGIGTVIDSAQRTTDSGVKAITAMKDVCLVTVAGRGIVGVPGVAAKTFTAVANANANVLMISQSSSENGICFVIDAADAAATRDKLKQSFAPDLAHHTVEHITTNEDVAIVAAVGERMRGVPGIAGKIFGALGDKGINVMLIAQGSSEYNVSFVVARAEMRDAVNAVHDEFGLAGGSSAIEFESETVAEA